MVAFESNLRSFETPKCYLVRALQRSNHNMTTKLFGELRKGNMEVEMFDLIEYVIQFAFSRYTRIPEANIVFSEMSFDLGTSRLYLWCYSGGASGLV